jgi:hypothetical protein
LDPDNRIAETDESDNSITFEVMPVLPTNLPMKFQTPIGRRANADWAINNYADVDPRSKFAADYRNGPFQYEGHNAIDAGRWGFSGQDQGIPILVAADGIVDAMQDWYFDREQASVIGPETLFELITVTDLKHSIITSPRTALR